MPNDTKTLEKAIELYGLKGVHPAAALVPMMGDEDYQALVEDAKQNGFLNPVKVTNEGLLIDGRNRLCVSLDISLDVPIERYNPADAVGVGRTAIKQAKVIQHFAPDLAEEVKKDKTEPAQRIPGNQAAGTQSRSPT